MEIQKKWFIYIGDHHEGPFSVEEVSAKQKSGAVKPESYVWCEGMADWQMLSTVTELTVELKKLEQAEEAPKPQASSAKAKVTPQPIATPIAPKNYGKMIGLALGTLVGLIFVGVISLTILSRIASDEMHGNLRPTLVKIVDRFPFLSSAFKLVPSLNDVKPEEQTELEQAQVGLPENGVKIAFALSQNDPNRPYFYISTNLPHQTKLDLYLVGNSETLLNRLQYSTQTSVTTLHGFAKTDVLLSEGGQPLPKGEYQVFITESADQDEAVKSVLSEYPQNKMQVKTPSQVPTGHHFLLAKTYFIGGPRDDTYLTRLKAFHEKVKQNAEKEVLELKQYSDTLQLQFTTLTSEFNKLSKGKKPNPGAKAVWKKTSETWKQINNQLDQTIQTWSNETLQNEFFYGKTYGLVKSAYEAIKNLFTLENEYFDLDKNGDRASFDIQHGKALSEARDAIELLRTKVDLILKAPKSPSGLPTREGL